MKRTDRLEKPLITPTLKAATARLQAVGSPSARLDALLLLEHASGLSREHLLAAADDPLSHRAAKKFERCLQQREQRRPVAYITGSAHFYGLRLHVSPSVLIPRPETEAMIELALELPWHKALDVGTGSGAIALALKHERPKAVLTASDRSRRALAVAGHNAQKLGLKIALQQSDLLRGLDGRFDLIVANLPYLGEQRHLAPELSFEPRLALFSGRDGLVLYRRFFSTVSPCLNRDAHVLIEAEPADHAELIGLAEKAGLQLVRSRDLILQFKN